MPNQLLNFSATIYHSLQLLIIVKAGFGSLAHKVTGLRPKEPNAKNLKRVGWKLGFGELDNAHNGLKIEIKYRKTSFIQRNPSSAKFEKSSS